MSMRHAPRAVQGISVSPQARERFKTILIVLLLAAVVALAVAGVPAMRFRSEMRSIYLQRIRSECSSALTQASSLSRTAGASTSSRLAQIRSCIYGMQTLSQMSVAASAGAIISEDWFRALYDTIDQYNTLLITGMTTSDLQTSLYNSLSVLQEQLSALD